MLNVIHFHLSTGTCGVDYRFSGGVLLPDIITVVYPKVKQKE